LKDSVKPYGTAHQPERREKFQKRRKSLKNSESRRSNQGIKTLEKRHILLVYGLLWDASEKILVFLAIPDRNNKVNQKVSHLKRFDCW